MNERTPATRDDKVARRNYLWFCVASVVFLTLVVLFTTLVLVG